MGSAAIKTEEEVKKRVIQKKRGKRKSISLVPDLENFFEMSF